jgi:hypothetical protein
MRRVVRNQSEDRQWSVDELTYTEVARQTYPNCHIATGFVEGHEHDTIYLEITGPEKHDVFLLMTPDEAAAIAWVLSGALWSLHVDDAPEPPRAAQMPLDIAGDD